MSESERRKKARDLIRRTGHHLGRAGGHLSPESDYESDKKMVERAIHEHERHDHKGESLTKLKLADGGIADGEASHSRADRGKRGKAHTRINILVAPGESQPHPVPVPVPVHPGAPPGAAMPPRPPVAAPPPPMAGPPGVPPGGGLGVRPGMPGVGMPPTAPMMRKSGGRAGRPHMTAGSGSGEGRLEKTKALDYCEGGRA